jgi:hypothetical protein
MKLNHLKLIPIYYAGVALLLSTPAQAVNVTKLDSANMDAATGWSAVPATTDVGEFNSTVSAGNLASLTLNGANLTLGGLKLDAGLQGPLTIALGNTLNLGTSVAGVPSLDMTLADQDLTINCLVGATANEFWLVPSGRTLTFGTNVTIAGTFALNITNNGSILSSGTAFGFGIIGANSGLLLNGSGSFSATNATVTVLSSQTTSTAPTATAPVAASTSKGFIVNGETVSLAQVRIGTGNSGTSMLVNDGSLTVSGSALIGNSTSGSRWTYAQIAGGTFTVNDTVTGLQLSKQNGTAQKCLSEL